MSSDVVAPSPRTYLFHEIPSLPGAWRHCRHCTHGGGLEEDTAVIVHMGVDQRCRALMSPVLSCVGELQSSSEYSGLPQDMDSQLSCVEPWVDPRGVGEIFPLCLSIQGTDSQCPAPRGYMGICP